MSFQKIYQTVKTNTTVKLITAENAPLILGFLLRSFKNTTNNLIANAVSEKDLASQLADFLFEVNELEKRYPKASKDYLTDWTNAGFLRKYPGANDEFIFELTPSTENAFKWLDSLDKNDFVGTESRLKSLFEKLKELSGKSNRDSAVRIKELEAKKRQIELEIESIKQGKLDILDDRQIKEQYFIIEETAKNLLGDFRQVEQNFRDLDRKFRQRVIVSNLSKGKVLEELFQQQDHLFETDQGKSFIAFWEFLLSQSTQAEFENLIDDIINIPVVKRLQKENFSIANLRNNLVDAGDKAKKSTNSLLEQLRKFLEHKSLIENKLIYDNIQDMLKIIAENPGTDFSKTDLLFIEDQINIDLVMNREIFNPPQKVKFATGSLEEGIAVGDNAKLFEQFEISITELKNNIKNALKNRNQIAFSEFVKEFEISKGVAEVVAYIEIASKEKHKHILNDDLCEEIDIKNIKTDKRFKVKIPQIIFCK